MADETNRDLLEEPVPIISLAECSKSFGGKLALQDAALDVRRGDIHGLIGQNGSGKSTLIKILSGYYAPDGGGTISVRGLDVPLPLKPDAPRQLGFAFVHQDLGLVESASVVETVRLGRYRSGFAGRVNWRRERQIVAEALESFGISIPPDSLIGSLHPVDRAQVAIVRALEQLRGVSGGLLVLDEPTPHLPRDTVERLFATVRAVAAAGTGVIFVTHRMDEVRELTTRVTILRDGRIVAAAATESLSDDEIAYHLLGFSLASLYPGAAVAPATKDVALVATDVSGRVMSKLTLELRKGQILGVTGLLHMGWEELPYLLYGAASEHADGSLTIGGETKSLAKLTPRAARANGLALVPADRLGSGSVQSWSVRHNATLATFRRFFVRGFLRHRRERDHAAALLSQYGVTPPEPDVPFQTLSGGNQQKVVLARWFESAPAILLLHEPTQGVDIGARSEIFKRLRAAADGGMSLLIASAEYEDLAHICDRVLVFRDGRVVAELSGDELTYARVLEQAFAGASSRGATA